MSSLPSAQFRKTFPRLTEPVAVTSHGHLLGTWAPGATGDIDAALDEALVAQRDALLVENAALTENIQALGHLNIRNDTIENAVVAERDALRLEVEYLNSRLAGAPQRV